MNRKQKIAFIIILGGMMVAGAGAFGLVPWLLALSILSPLLIGLFIMGYRSNWRL